MWVFGSAKGRGAARGLRCVPTPDCILLAATETREQAKHTQDTVADVRAGGGARQQNKNSKRALFRLATWFAQARRAALATRDRAAAAARHTGAQLRADIGRRIAGEGCSLWRAVCGGLREGIVFGNDFRPRLPPAVAGRLLLSALTAAIEYDPGLTFGVKSAR